MWNDLTMSERADVIKMAVKAGLRDMKSIRDFYDKTLSGNTYEDGGKLSDQGYYSIMERVAEKNNPIWNRQRIEEGYEPLSVDEEYTRVLNDNSYNYRGYYEKYPEASANASTHWTDEFKTAYHPSFSNESKYSGKVDKNYNPLGLPGGFWVGETFIPKIWQLHANAPKYADGGPKATYGKPYYSYDKNMQIETDNGKPILNYSATLPEVNIIPDSKKSPADRNEARRFREKIFSDNAEREARDYTQRQIMKSQRDWDNSLEKKALGYTQDALTGAGIGADIVSGLPIYSSLKGARVLSEANSLPEYVEGGLWLAPIGGVLGKEAYNTGKAVYNTLYKKALRVKPFETVQESANNVNWDPDHWFKDISGRTSYSQEEASELASHMPEYRNIEKRLFNEGKLVKDSNGNIIVKNSEMSPQEYIMRQSEAFKKMNPEHHYTGVNRGLRYRFENESRAPETENRYEVWTDRKSPKNVEEYAMSPKGGEGSYDDKIKTMEEKIVRVKNNLDYIKKSLDDELKNGKIAQEEYNEYLFKRRKHANANIRYLEEEINRVKQLKEKDPLNGGKVFDVTYPKDILETPIIDAENAHWARIPGDNVKRDAPDILMGKPYPSELDTDRIVTLARRKGYGVTHINNVMDTYNGTMLNETIIGKDTPVKSVLGNTGSFDTKGPNKWLLYRSVLPFTILSGTALSNQYAGGGPKNTNKEYKSANSWSTSNLHNILTPASTALINFGKYGRFTDIRKGGTPEETYFLPRSIQRQEFLSRGYTEAPNDYGLVKRAVNNRNIPVYQTKADDISREKVIPISNINDRWFGKEEAELEHPGHYPTAIYYSPYTNEYYQKGWDLNDYGGGTGAYNNYSTFGKIKADIADAVGSPVVTTTGISRIGSLEDMMKEKDTKDIAIDFLNSKGLVPMWLPTKELPILNMEGKPFYDLEGKPITYTINEYVPSLPEITITGKRRKKVK